MTSVVGTVNARSITTQRHEPGNALLPVVRSPQGVIKLTDRFNCLARLQTAAKRLAVKQSRKSECGRSLILRPLVPIRTGRGVLGLSTKRCNCERYSAARTSS